MWNHCGCYSNALGKRVAADGFMKNEMTGIEVDEQIIARYPENATKEEGEAVGIEIAREVMAQTADFVDGYYFSFPFNRVYLLEKILQL